MLCTNVAKVNVTADGFQGYYVSYAEWVSAFEWTGKVNIKDDQDGKRKNSLSEKEIGRFIDLVKE